MKQTIHTSRTIMSAEFIEVMDCQRNGASYASAMADNVFNKKTESGKKKTILYLAQLYGFQEDAPNFKALEDYWQRVKQEDKPTLAFLFAVGRDYLLRESVSFVKSVPVHEKAAIEGFEGHITRHHPKRFSPKTLRSVAQNIASSWKQAGYIQGKVKNIRVKRTPSYLLVAFALLMAYIDGARGEYMLGHPSVKALDVSREELHQLLKAAADRDLLQYQQSGSTLVISFENYLKKLGDG